MLTPVDCKLVEEELPNGDWRYSCPDCSQAPLVYEIRMAPIPRRTCKVDDPTRPKPGTELTLIFQSLKVEQIKGCTCEAIAAEMDRLGPDECRANRAELLDKLAANYRLYGLGGKLKAGASALLKGLPLSLEGLFELAIEQAEEKARQPGSS